MWVGIIVGFMLGICITLLTGLWIEYLANREYWLLKFLFPLWMSRRTFKRAVIEREIFAIFGDPKR